MVKKGENMQKKRFVGGVFVVLAILILIILFVICLINVKNTNLKEQATDKVKEIANLVKSGATQKKLEKALEIDEMVKNNIMIGPDSYVRDKLNEQLISANNLSSYVLIQEQCSHNLEKMIKNNFVYDIKEINVKNEQVSLMIEFKTYYYGTYLMDLYELQKQLLQKANLEENAINNYKAKIRGMQILDSKLKQYKNEESMTKIITYSFKNDSDRKNALSSFVLALDGFLYQNDTVSEFDESRTARISTYITEAIDDGIIKSDSYL